MADLLFILIGISCFAYVDSFTSFVKYKLVKLEVSCTMILPPMVSVLWITNPLAHTRSLS